MGKVNTLPAPSRLKALPHREIELYIALLVDSKFCLPSRETGISTQSHTKAPSFTQFIVYQTRFAKYLILSI